MDIEKDSLSSERESFVHLCSSVNDLFVVLTSNYLLPSVIPAF